MSNNYLEERNKLNSYLNDVKEAKTDREYLQAAYILLLSFGCFKDRIQLHDDIYKYIKTVKRHSTTDWKQTDLEEYIKDIKSGGI